MFNRPIFQFFKQSKADHKTRKLNLRQCFLVVNGQGVTVFNRGKERQEFHLHTPHHDNLENWFRQPRVFTGLVQMYMTSLRYYNPDPGDQIIFLNFADGTYSQVLDVEAVFRSSDISKQITPSVFTPHIGDENVLSEIAGITSYDEYRGFTTLIQNLFMRAMIADSWTVSARTVFQCSGYHLPELLEPWVSALADAEMVKVSDGEYIIQNPLIFSMMHAINRHYESNIFEF